MIVSPRGEIEFDLAGTPIRLVPTYAGLAEIEKVTGKSLMTLAQLAMLMGNIGLRDAAAIIHSTAVPAGKWTLEEIGELLLEDGVTGVAGVITALLAVAISGRAEKNREAPPTGGAKTPTTGTTTSSETPTAGQSI